MRRPLTHFRLPTFVCAVRGHVTPAMDVESLRPEDSGVGVDLADGRRSGRCLRCDAWSVRPLAGLDRTPGGLPDLHTAELPRRGKELRDAVVMRLISIERGIHSVVFGIAAIVLLWLYFDIPLVHTYATRFNAALATFLAESGQAPSQSYLAGLIDRAVKVSGGTFLTLGLTAAAYCVVEGVEAVGLWYERRWAEYLTVLATAGFLPFEIDALAKRVTVLRVGALAVNIAIVVYLVWAKHLFGVRGGAETLHEQLDVEATFGACVPQEPTSALASGADSR